MSFLERCMIKITAFMFSYHYSVPVYDPRAILLNYLGPRCALELHKNLFSLDVCLNMCSSAIRYACSCRSVYIFFVPLFLCLFSLLFFCVFFCTTYILKFFYLIISAYTFVCSLKINQSINQQF